MNIVTIEHLAANFVTSILAPLYDEFKEQYPDGGDFDEWLYRNLHDLGEQVYTVIGEHYGDCNDAIKELYES